MIENKEKHVVKTEDEQIGYMYLSGPETAPDFVLNHQLFHPDEIQEISNSLDRYRSAQSEARVGGTHFNENQEMEDRSKIDSEVRRTKVSFLNYGDSDPVLSAFYEKIGAIVNDVNFNVFKFNLTGIQALQLGRYLEDDKGHYEWHQDQSIARNPTNDVRKLSFSLLITEPGEDFEGGEFEFRTGQDILRPKLRKGSIVFFPSPMLHRVKPVTKGLRESIVGWITGPNWV